MKKGRSALFKKMDDIYLCIVICCLLKGSVKVDMQATQGEDNPDLKVVKRDDCMEADPIL